MRIAGSWRVARGSENVESGMFGVDGDREALKEEEVGFLIHVSCQGRRENKITPPSVRDFVPEFSGVVPGLKIDATEEPWFARPESPGPVP